jgi:hypothetical protein
MGFWNALSALAPVAPAMSDAKDLRTAREQDAAKFASDQALAEAQLTTQKLAAQLDQQRLRASNQPMFKAGSQPEFNPTSGTYQQPAWDDKKQAYAMVDVPGVSPEEQEKYQLDSFNKNRAAAKALMPEGKPEDWDYLGYTLSGIKPPPITKFTPLTGAAGQPQEYPKGSGNFVVFGRDATGAMSAQSVPAGYTPPAPKPSTSPSAIYANLLTKKILADKKQGPPLSNEEAAQLIATRSALDEPGITRMNAMAQANAANHLYLVTDPVTGMDTAVPVSAGIAAFKQGTPYLAGAVSAPTGMDKKNQMLAASALTQIDSMERVLAADPNLTGPGAGQLTKLQNWLGSGSEDAGQFLAASTFLAEHGVGVFGGRNIHSIEDLQNLMGDLKKNPAQLKAALEQARTTMQPWATAGGRLPGPRAAGGGGTTYKQTATGPNNHKIGSNDGGNIWYDVQTGRKVQ